MVKEDFNSDLEWEAFSFPLMITDLSSDNGMFGFSGNSKLMLERTEDFQLKGTINGNVSTVSSLRTVNRVGKGNIIVGENVRGKDHLGNSIELQDFHILTFDIDSITSDQASFEVTASVSAGLLTIRTAAAKEATSTTRFDWFICSDISAHFWGTTRRTLLPERTKVRQGIDKITQTQEANLFGSYTKDYVTVNTEECQFIIAKVPAIFVDKSLTPLCFEFRQDGEFHIPPEDYIDSIAQLVSFLLGNKLIKCGYSLVENGHVHTAVFFSLDKDSLRFSAKVAMPPIRFNTRYDWGDFAWQLNKFVPQYTQQEKVIKLGAALERYWISKTLSIGVNLPLLSNAIEIIAGDFLSKAGDSEKKNIDETDFKIKLEPILKQLESVLSHHPNYQIVLNNVRKSNDKSINVRILKFFELLEITLSKDEKAALQLRNKMAHGVRDYSSDNRTYDDLILTRVYEVLFNKIVLKLLKYEEYYTDYSRTGCPYRPMLHKLHSFG